MRFPRPYRAMPCHATPFARAVLPSGPTASGCHVCFSEARSASPLANPPSKIRCRTSRLGCFRAPYAAPGVRRDARPTSRAKRPWPVPCRALMLQVRSCLARLFALNVLWWYFTRVQGPAGSSGSIRSLYSCPCIRRKLELADKVLDCYKLDVYLWPNPEQALEPSCLCVCVSPPSSPSRRRASSDHLPCHFLHRVFRYPLGGLRSFLDPAATTFLFCAHTDFSTICQSLLFLFNLTYSMILTWGYSR